MSQLRAWQRLLLSFSVVIAALYVLLDFGGSYFGAVALRVVILTAIGVLTGLTILHRKVLLVDISALFLKLRREWLLASFSLFCALTLASTMFFSWTQKPMGLMLQAGNLHDSVWHVALIKELQKQIPPQHPSSFENSVKNYHYYYDLGVAAIANTTGISSTFLHYQVMPILISIFLAIAAVGFARSVTTKNSFAYWLLFFIFFGGNAGFLIPIFFPTKSWMESSFWVSQTSSMMVNPQLLLSFALLLVLLSIPLWGNLVKNNRLFLASLVIIASLAGIKMYAFLLAVALLGLYLFVRLFNKNYKQVVVKLSILLIVSLGMLIRFTDISKQQLIFSPLWYVNTMVEAPDRLFVLDWKLREDTYLAEGAHLHYLALKAGEVIVFYGGNLGTRVLFFVVPALLLIRWSKKKSTTERELFVMSTAFAGFLISTTVPLLFIQSGVVWNTIQFWYYGLLFASILVALMLSTLPSVLPKSTITYPIICLVVIVLTLPAWQQTYFARFKSDELINASVLRVVSELNPGEKVMICPFGIYRDIIFKSSLVRALSDVQIYLADPVQLDLLGLDGDAKERELATGMWQESWLMDTIQKKQITSVICADEDWNSKMAPVLSAANVRILAL